MKSSHTSVEAILRLRQVLELTGRSKSNLYVEIRRQLFTRPVPLGGMVGWPAREVDALNRARIAGKSDDEIKRLVSDLHELRKA